MATAYKCPVCLWTSHQGKITARLIDDFEEGIAVGETKKEAMEQLREYLVHRSKKDDFFWLDPDFDEPEIRQVRVRVVPEYHDNTRRFPCKEPILLKLPCAIGQRSTGLWAACFPTLDLYFDFYDKGRFNELANHYAKHTLSELTPRELSRFLPPASCEIDYLNVTLKEQTVRFDESQETPNLLHVADPIGKRTLGRISRPGSGTGKWRSWPKHCRRKERTFAWLAQAAAAKPAPWSRRPAKLVAAARKNPPHPDFG